MSHDCVTLGCDGYFQHEVIAGIAQEGPPQISCRKSQYQQSEKRTITITREGTHIFIDIPRKDDRLELFASPKGDFLRFAESLVRGTLGRTMGRASRKVRLDTDIKPVSEFRANAAELIEQVRTTGRPLVLTQRGHSAAVVLDVTDYQQMVDEAELLRDVRMAVEQIEAGKGVSNRTAKGELRRRFAR